MTPSLYVDALNRLCQPVRAVDFPRSLGPMRHLLARLGNPEQAYPAVLVTGSTGKGTTCHQIVNVLNGMNTGLFTGPHLHSFRERMMIDERMIEPDELVEGVERVLAVESEIGLRYSTFERTTALALWWFQQRQVRLGVLEVGMGGRWDAVNAAASRVALITPLEREHLAMLGGSLQTIAWHKAGIIRPGGHVILEPQLPEAEDVLLEVIARQSAHLHPAESGQAAHEGLRILMEKGIVPQKPLPDILALPNFLGRRELIHLEGKPILIDGGHTPRAAYALRQHIESLYPKPPVHLVVAMLKDKAAADYLRVFDETQFHVTFTSLTGHRGLTASDLEQQVGLRQAQVRLEPRPEVALEQARRSNGLSVICGSLRLAALAREYYGLLNPDELDEARVTRSIFEGADYLARL